MGTYVQETVTSPVVQETVMCAAPPVQEAVTFTSGVGCSTPDIRSGNSDIPCCSRDCNVFCTTCARSGDVHVRSWLCSTPDICSGNSDVPSCSRDCNVFHHLCKKL